MRHMIFYVKNPHTNYGNKKKPWGLKHSNLNLLYKSSYIDLSGHFTLNTYSLVSIIWFTSTTQQPSIAPVDHFNLAKGIKVFNLSFKDLIFEWNIRNGVHFKLSH